MVAGLPSPHTHTDTQKAAKRTWRSVNGGRRNKKPFLLGDSAGFLFLCVRAAYQTSLSAHVCVFLSVTRWRPAQGPPVPATFSLSACSLLPDPCCFSPPCFKMHVAVFPAFQARVSHERTQSRQPNLPLAALLYPSRFVCILRVFAVWIFLPLLHVHRNSPCFF